MINTIKSPIFFLLLLLTLLVQLQGNFLSFFLDDPGLYGTIAKEMIARNDYWQLFHEGKDWLDKPHMPFWATAFSFKLLGINAFSYKLPSLLCLLAAALYCYRFAKEKYDLETAYWAVFILLAAQYSFMTATEGRVENFVMLSIIAAVYHGDKSCNTDNSLKYRLLHITLASFWAAFGLMSKGTFVGIIIAVSLGIPLLFKKQYRSIPFLFLALPLTALFILPELYALWIQFDSQPHKVVFKMTGVSGIRWFLWDSQFSRFVNAGPITRAKGDVFFFLHTALWAFLPWSIIWFSSIYMLIKKAILKGLPEYYSLVGSLFTLLLFSLAKFQLPHYLSVAFPFMAIMLASTLHQLNINFIRIVQGTQICVLALVLLLLPFILAPSFYLLEFLFFAVLLALVFFIGMRSKKALERSLFFSGLFVIAINAYLHFRFYPLMLNYKADVQAGLYLEKNYPNEPIFVLGPISNRFNFYAPQSPIFSTEIKLLEAPKPLLLLCTNEALMTWIKGQNLVYEELKVFKHYSGEDLNLKFLLAQSRKETLKNFYLLRIN